MSRQIGPKFVCFSNLAQCRLSLNWLATSKSPTQTKFKHATSSSPVSVFKTTDGEAGDAYQTIKGGIYSSSPLSTRKRGEMCWHKNEGGGGVGEKRSTSPRSQIPGATFVICDFFSVDLKQSCEEVRGGIPSPGTVPQRGRPFSPVASADASLGSRPRSREGVNPQKFYPISCS